MTVHYYYTYSIEMIKISPNNSASNHDATTPDTETPTKRRQWLLQGVTKQASLERQELTTRWQPPDAAAVDNGNNNDWEDDAAPADDDSLKNNNNHNNIVVASKVVKNNTNCAAVGNDDVVVGEDDQEDTLLAPADDHDGDAVHADVFAPNENDHTDDDSAVNRRDDTTMKSNMNGAVKFVLGDDLQVWMWNEHLHCFCFCAFPFSTLNCIDTSFVQLFE